MTSDKQQRYEELLPQVAALVEGETEEMSVLANVSAALHEQFGFWWTGFYLVRNTGSDQEKEGKASAEKGKLPSRELRLGPFQGPVACMHIGYGRGVCGTAWQRGQTVIVPDVELFPGHIACSSASRSEIVVPIHDKSGNVVGVLDIDSRELATFDETDRHYLEQLAGIVSRTLYT